MLNLQQRQTSGNKAAGDAWDDDEPSLEQVSRVLPSGYA